MALIHAFTALKSGEWCQNKPVLQKNDEDNCQMSYLYLVPLQIVTPVKGLNVVDIIYIYLSVTSLKKYSKTKVHF